MYHVLTDPSLPVAIVESLAGLLLLSKAADLFVDGAVEVATTAVLFSEFVEI